MYLPNLLISLYDHTLRNSQPQFSIALSLNSPGFGQCVGVVEISSGIVTELASGLTFTIPAYGYGS